MKKTVKHILTVLCSISILVYAIFQLSLTAGDTIETENTFYSVVNEVINTQGYIFRDEALVIENEDGNRSYLVENGERVSKNQELCVTYQDTAEADVQERINEINAQLAVLEESNGTYFADLGRINDNIYDCMMDIQESVAAGDLQTAERLQNTLLIQMNRRQATVEGDSEYYKKKINDLKAEKQSLENSLFGNKITTTHSKLAGYFYTEVDGYENLFSATALQDMSLTGFKKLINGNNDSTTNTHAVGKIAESSKWYMAFVCSRREAAGFEKGRDYTISFPYSEMDIKMTMERSSVSGDSDEVMMVFSCHSLPTDFKFTRKQEINIIKSSTEGLKVRISALRRVDGKTGVYVLYNNRVVFKTAEVIKESGGFYLVALPDPTSHTIRSATKLSIHDIVILSGKNLYEGKVIQ